MQEVRTKIDAYRVEQPCGENCAGTLKVVVGGSHFTLYLHRCTVCNREERLTRAYPHIEYGEAE